MIKIRDNRDVRGPLCGNVSLPPEWESRYFYLSPREIICTALPEVADRLDARLRGEHAQVFKRGEQPIPTINR